MKIERKLHIGGRERAKGWEIFNVIEGEHVDHLGNANNFSRFEDNSFSIIYASHVLEHFEYKDEVANTLKEWYRVLDWGGKLYISVPDMGVLSELFLDKQNLSVKERYLVIRMIFGGHLDQHDYHLAGFSQDILVQYLNFVGFKEIFRANKFNFFDDSSSMRFKDKNISLNMVAIKSKKSLGQEYGRE